MNEKQIEEFKKIVEEEEARYDFSGSISDFWDEEAFNGIDNITQLEEYLTDLDESGSITNIEITYYSNAIKYLAENDTSLMESVEIATDFGISLNKINSELLASLHATRKNEEDYPTFINNVISKITFLN